MKLAEGAIGDVNALPEGALSSLAMPHPLRVVALESMEQSTSFGFGPQRDGGSASGGAGGGAGPSDRVLSRSSTGEGGMGWQP